MEITQSAIGSFGREMRMRAARRHGAWGKTRRQQREGGRASNTPFLLPYKQLRPDRESNVRPLVTKVPVVSLWYFANL